MKRLFNTSRVMALALSLAVVSPLAAYAGTSSNQFKIAATTYKAGTYSATAKGYGGDVSVEVTVDSNGKITAVKATGKDETTGIGSNAIDKLPAAFVKAGGTKVDVVSGATVTSKALINAVGAAVKKAVVVAAPAATPKPAATPAPTPAPTPEPEPEETFKLIEDDYVITYADFAKEVSSWKTKLEKGDAYKLAKGTWASQMEVFQEKLYKGKTVAELKAWFGKYTASNGRPLTASATGDNKTKYDALGAADKAMLADLTSAATMSLNDSHGNLLGAVEKAYETKRNVNGNKAAYIGFGINTVPRDRGSYAQFNTTVAAVLFDEQDRIVDVIVDVVEVSTNETNWPGWPSETVTVDASEKAFNSIKSKRDRGDAYNMARAATTKNEWYVQMNNFEKFFVGMTAPEVKAWYEKYTGQTGKPLTKSVTNEYDIAKWSSLTYFERERIEDVTSSATMSLNDAHSDIVGAIVEAYNNKKAVSGEVASFGIGYNNVFRKGPGKSEDGTPVYSFNESYAAVAFDKDGKVVKSITDVLEVATPNYDGAAMPHISGLPGQNRYVTDVTHKGEVYLVPAKK